MPSDRKDDPARVDLEPDWTEVREPVAPWAFKDRTAERFIQRLRRDPERGAVVHIKDLQRFFRELLADGSDGDGAAPKKPQRTLHRKRDIRSARPRWRNSL